MKLNYPLGATPLEPEELAELIPSHLRTQEELNAWEEQNIISAQKWALKQKELLSITSIKNLHEHMFNETWKWAGKFRTTDKNIGVHWSQISTQTQNLCNDVQFQIEDNTFSKDEIVIRFHHKLVWIHPFPNGNGRHARLMADLLIAQLGGPRFSWGMYQDLLKPTVVRQEYIKALQCADKGDYSKLLVFARS